MTLKAISGTFKGRKGKFAVVHVLGERDQAAADIAEAAERELNAGDVTPEPAPAHPPASPVVAPAVTPKPRKQPQPEPAPSVAVETSEPRYTPRRR